MNFATGAIALYAAYTYASLRDGELLLLFPGLPSSIDLGGPLGFGPAASIALAINAVFGALLYLLVFRPLRDAPPLARAVASLGVLVVVQEMMAIRVGTAPVSVEAIFPAERWELGSINVLSDRVYLAASVVALTLLLAAAYRFTRFGLVTRAAAESETGAYVSGVAPDRVALLNWMISATVAGVAGILIAPISPLTPITHTLFVVPALAAALVGGFQSLLPTVGAGIAIDLRDRPAGELSQGQRQLVSMARACAAEPTVLLLDEPAAGLDSTESRWLGDRIRAIAATGTGVLLVDHDVALVLDLCDRIYVLDFGRVTRPRSRRREKHLNI